jgi:hypothetical protein
MAKNKLTKWIIGAASIAAFTGFIGSINQLDATKQSALGPTNEIKDNTTTTVENDPIKEEWLHSSYFEEEDEDDHGEKAEYSSSRNSMNGGNGQTSQQPQIRSRAS